jgi:hypothetical protein
MSWKALRTSVTDETMSTLSISVSEGEKVAG